MGCYTKGECLGAAFEDFQPLKSEVDCHRLCINTDGCRFFTHYGAREADAGCFAYLNCPEYNDSGCSDCISGEVECPLEGSETTSTEQPIVQNTVTKLNCFPKSNLIDFFQCEVAGRCKGIEVDFITGVLSPGAVQYGHS